jgi:hypothetical protein
MGWHETFCSRKDCNPRRNYFAHVRYRWCIGKPTTTIHTILRDWSGWHRNHRYGAPRRRDTARRKRVAQNGVSAFTRNQLINTNPPDKKTATAHVVIRRHRLKKTVTITITYGDGAESKLKVPVKSISNLIHVLVSEAARFRRTDRARKVTIRI